VRVPRAAARPRFGGPRPRPSPYTAPVAGDDDVETEDLGAVGTGAATSPPVASVQGCVLEVIDGPKGRRSHTSRGERVRIGSHERNDLILDDRTVSRFHCEVRLSEDGARLSDLGSRNGTLLDGVPIVEAYLRDQSVIKLGETTLRFRFASDRQQLRLSPRTRFGTLVGRSVAMRATFAELERASETDSTVLLIGETGTGKEEAARSVHDASGRAEGAFVVVDCGSIPETLLESELFGHERGAFTGALQKRIGAFASADGGTVFLDEIGEMPIDLQPRLLRVLESRIVRPLGSEETRSVDVRVIAATNRDLRAEVNEGRFREDLYYRLAVLEIELPPVRQRPDDIPLLAEHLVEHMTDDEEEARSILDDALLAQLSRNTWPGNVRQLRNYLEYYVALREMPPMAMTGDEVPGGPPVDPRIPYEVARRQALDDFERRYLAALLEAHDGNVSEAARRAGMNRAYLHRLLRRHSLR